MTVNTLDPKYIEKRRTANTFFSDGRVLILEIKGRKYVSSDISESNTGFLNYFFYQSGLFKNPEIEFNISENDLTEFSMKSAENSFFEYWEDEDDDYWNQYLNDQ